MEILWWMKKWILRCNTFTPLFSLDPGQSIKIEVKVIARDADNGEVISGTKVYTVVAGSGGGTGTCNNGETKCFDSTHYEVCNNGGMWSTPISCSDGNPCTIDTCINGECYPTPNNCDDNNLCTRDYCSHGECYHTNTNEGQPCGPNKHCQNGYCVGGTCLPNGESCNPNSGPKCCCGYCSLNNSRYVCCIPNGESCSSGPECCSGICSHDICASSSR